MNSIEKGSKDYWTVTPKRIAALEAAAAAEAPAVAAAGAAGGEAAAAAAGGDAAARRGRAVGGRGARRACSDGALQHRPARSQDARSARLHHSRPTRPISPPPPSSSTRCSRTASPCLKATAAFTVAGKSYPGGSYVVKTAQAFRPHVMDMFEPQDHPNDFAYPGGPPNRPTTSPAGRWPMQMGVQFDRILDGFDGPFTKVNGLLPPPAEFHHRTGESGGLPDQPPDQQFVHPDQPPAEGRRRRLLAEEGADGGRPGSRARAPSGFRLRPPRAPMLEKAAKELGVPVHALAQGARGRCPEAEADPHRPLRSVRRHACRPAGRGGCSSSMRCRSSGLSRRRSTPAT